MKSTLPNPLPGILPDNQVMEFGWSIDTWCNDDGSPGWGNLNVTSNLIGLPDSYNIGISAVSNEVVGLKIPRTRDCGELRGTKTTMILLFYWITEKSDHISVPNPELYGLPVPDATGLLGFIEKTIPNVAGLKRGAVRAFEIDAVTINCCLCPKNQNTSPSNQDRNIV